MASVGFLWPRFQRGCMYLPEGVSEFRGKKAKHTKIPSETAYALFTSSGMIFKTKLPFCRDSAAAIER